MASTQRHPNRISPSALDRRRARQVAAKLKADYPDVTCALAHRNPFQLLIATILSAQCTDKQVNRVTPELFKQYPTAAHFAQAPITAIEGAIHSTGFFHNKARNIKACCVALIDQYQGEVPRDLDALTALPGIGRKTANVVLGTAFGLATGIVVDTHVGRICRRLGLTDEKDAVKVEKDLMQVIPKAEWIDFSHRLIHHGRRICSSRKPLCDQCSMRHICPKIGLEKECSPSRKQKP